MVGPFAKSIEELEADMVCLLGVPWDEKSSHIRGAADAPTRIRAVMRAGSTNLSTEGLINLAFENRFVDAGDLELRPGNDAMEDITAGVRSVLERGVRVISLGGDHAVAFPIVRAFVERYPGLNILQIDAHPDLYDECDGDPYSHGCPFARIMETGRVARLVQVGIRANTPHQQEQAVRFGVEMVDMRSWRAGLKPSFDGPLYVSLDLDGIDPGMSPGVAHPEPGGLTSREVISLIQDVQGEIVGADIVELIPKRDLNDISTMVAIKCLKELAGRMLARD